MLRACAIFTDWSTLMPMNCLRSLRPFLVCLMILMLAIQGASASALALRMAAPAEVMTTASMQDESAAIHVGCHDMGVAQHDQTARHEHEQHPATPAKAKVCGTCCTGAMLDVMTAPQVPEPLLGEHFSSRLTPAPKGFIPDTPKRPPRQLS